jgi:hypothetical protein
MELFPMRPYANGTLFNVFTPTPSRSDALYSYYVAAGVRIYSQDSWKQLFGDDGRKKVEAYIQQTVGQKALVWHIDLWLMV